jgi:hypothetical protein
MDKHKLPIDTGRHAAWLPHMLGIATSRRMNRGAKAK